MTYLASPQTTAIGASFNSTFSQSQQTSWTYEKGREGTAVTYLSKVTEEKQKTTIDYGHETNIYDNQWGYWALTNKKSQDMPRPVQNWQFAKLLIMLSSQETWLDLVKITSSENWQAFPPLIQSHNFVRGSWGIMLSSQEVEHDLAKITSIWDEKSTSATFISEIQIQLLERKYVYRDDAEINQFIREHPFLAQLLLDAYSKIEVYFPGAKVFLEVATDYEAFDHISTVMDGDKELVASISTSLQPEEAIKVLDKFCDDWWLKVLEEARGKLSFGLEFQ